jgi:hypothetical protein
MNGATVSIVEKSSARIMDIVEEYASSIEGIQVPEQFKFLKYLSRYYADRIRSKLAASTHSRHEL